MTSIQKRLQQQMCKIPVGLVSTKHHHTKYYGNCSTELVNNSFNFQRLLKL